MKKLLWIGLMMVMALFLPVVALAEEITAVAASAVKDLPVDPFSWEQLATIAGATTATLLIVQLLKLPLDKVWKIPTRIIAYVIALIIMLVATAFTVGLTASNAGLAAINAVIVALAAMGAYELTFRKLDDKKAAAADEPEPEKVAEDEA